MFRYMNTMVTTEYFPTELCSREAKEQFARAVLKERANKRKLQVALFIFLRLSTCRRWEFLDALSIKYFQETVREFSLLSRGLLGSEYAAQLVQLGL